MFYIPRFGFGTTTANASAQYGLSSVPVMASVGSIYLNFGLWAVSLVPAWTVVRKFGVERKVRVDV